MSLVKLAEEGNLPPHQYMDEETVNWIKKNRPQLVSAPGFTDTNLMKGVLQRFIPKKEWFLLPEEVDGIHGLRHTMRVTGFTSLFSRYLENPSAIIAASLHDLRRQNDRGDLGHAKRAAEWLKENKEVIFEHYKIGLPDDTLEEIYFAIYFHEKPYEEIGNNSDYLKHKEVVDMVKTADALDRYRLPRLKWWINDNLLKLKPSDNLKQFAYNLVVASEEGFLKSRNSVSSVLDSLTKYE